MNEKINQMNDDDEVDGVTDMKISALNTTATVGPTGRSPEII